MKRSIGAIILGGAALLTVSGCDLPGDKAKLIKIEGANASALVYTASIRGTYFKSANATSKFCAEPAPDVALDTLQKFAAELNIKVEGSGEGGGKVSSEVSSKVVELAGRTQLILLARELLYRACELSLNQPDVSSQEIINMYAAVVQLVKDLGTSDLIAAQADQTVAEAALIEARAKAEIIIGTRKTRIDAIVSHVSKADKSIDKDKLKALLDKAASAALVRDFIEGATDADDLSSRLQDVSSKTLGDIAAGIS